VIDASVAVRWFLAEESTEVAGAVLERVTREPELFAVPELFFFEVLAVLGRVHPRAVAAYLDGFLPVVEASVFRHPMTASLADQSAPFVEMGLTGCDACYAGLAAELGAKWITFDGQAHGRISTAGVSADLNEGLPPGW
jgi:predicted nucleic acid-binding protein